MWRRLGMRFRPYSIALIAVMWLLMWGDISWGNVLAGLAVGLVVTLVLPLPSLPIKRLRVRWLALAGLFVAFWRDLVVSSVKVAWVAVRRPDPPASALLHVPMRVQEDFVLWFAVTLMNLQPGGSVTDIDIANRMLTVHLLDAGTPAEIEAEMAHYARLERKLIRIFETGEAS